MATPSSDAHGEASRSRGDVNNSHGDVNNSNSDVNNSDSDVNNSNGNVTKPNSDDVRRAREAGWTERSALDYTQIGNTEAGSSHFGGSSKVYEWSDEFGDVGPPVPELEALLFNGEHTMRQGEHIVNLELDVKIDGPTKLEPFRKFEDAGLHPVVLNNVKSAKYSEPTPIQCYTIPAVLQGYDVVAIAQTGSGKTAAYLLPILSRLMGKAKKLAAPRPDTLADGYNARLHQVKAEPLVVVVVPTRELALQIFDEARRMCYRSMLRPCVVYGGFPMSDTKDQLGAGCDILIATPGRLCDLMDKPHILSLSRVKYTVIDEADEMLHSDWEEELRKIMSGGDTNEDADHVYMMFSATFPKGVRAMAREYMAPDYFRIRIGRAGQAHKNIRQNVVYVDQDKKRDAVYDLLFQMKPVRTIIFCNSKIQVDLLDDFLYNKGLPTTSIHADRNQREREDAMRAFRVGRCPILIATGVSARGWDVLGVGHIINYDLPSGMYGGITEYVHRIGRTARIGHQGLATAFYNERNEDIAQDLVNILIECDCEVPEFLQHLVPEGGVLDFDDNSDDEGAADEGSAPAGATEASGGSADATNGNGGTNAASAWGAPSAAPDTGFAADGGFTADGGAAVSNW